MEFKQLSKIISQRRSIYPNMYSDKIISRETINAILKNACWAPNHKNTEPWRWKVFYGSQLEKLRDYIGEYYLKQNSSGSIADRKFIKVREKVMRSQAVVAICMYNDPNINIPEWEEVAAVACAVQNMWLSCSTLGIGAYWSSSSSARNARKFLQLEEHEKCLGWFYMGYSNGVEVKSQRRPIDEVVKWIDY